MSIWTKITTAISMLAKGEPLAKIFSKLKTPPEKSVAFTIAVIALGAKMAKSDGSVKKEEVKVFRRIFHIPESEVAAAGKVFDLARQDAAGYEVYARRIRKMFGERHQTLSDLMESLFHISLADGEYHPKENEFLRNVSEIFGFSHSDFSKLKARFVEFEDLDPHEILGVLPNSESCSATRLAKFDEMANPIPTEPPDCEKMAVLIPITSPSTLNNGPPEFPRLIDASVWMKSS